RYSLQFSPISEDEKLYSGGNGGSAWYYCLFPNFMLNILPGRVQTNLVQPLGPDRCRVTFHYYYDDIESPEALRFIAEDQDYSDKVQAEDMEICAHVQRGLESRAYDRGRFSVVYEEGVYHFQSLVRDAYRTWLRR
ncbi:MAG: SRPBCC family protein, partial [Gemmatimonadales bacterium]